MSRKLAAILAVILVLTMTSSAFAAEMTWTGATDGEWKTPANWGGTVPSGTDTAIIPDNAKDAGAILVTDDGAAAKNLDVRAAQGTANPVKITISDTKTLAVEAIRADTNLEIALAGTTGKFGGLSAVIVDSGAVVSLASVESAKSGKDPIFKTGLGTLELKSDANSKADTLYVQEGTLLLSASANNKEYASILSIDVAPGATLKLDTAGGLFSTSKLLARGNVEMTGGTLIFANAANAVSGNITGTGNMQVSDKLVLAGDNTNFTGATTVDASKELVIASAKALAGTSGITLGNASKLSVTESATITKTIAGTTAATFDVAAGKTLTLAQGFTPGGAYAVTKTGTGKLAVPGDFAAETNIDLKDGVLELTGSTIDLKAGTIALYDDTRVIVPSGAQLKNVANLDLSKLSANTAGIQVAPTEGDFKSGATVLDLSSVANVTSGGGADKLNIYVDMSKFAATSSVLQKDEAFIIELGAIDPADVQLLQPNGTPFDYLELQPDGTVKATKTHFFSSGGGSSGCNAGGGFFGLLTFTGVAVLFRRAVLLRRKG